LIILGKEVAYFELIKIRIVLDTKTVLEGTLISQSVTRALIYFNRERSSCLVLEASGSKDIRE
ncbi:unnamed protein product, partial [Allacma fusca]